MTNKKREGRFIWTEDSHPIATHAQEEAEEMVTRVRKELQDIYDKAKKAKAEQEKKG